MKGVGTRGGTCEVRREEPERGREQKGVGRREGEQRDERGEGREGRGGAWCMNSFRIVSTVLVFNPPH